MPKESETMGVSYLNQDTKAMHALADKEGLCLGQVGDRLHFLVHIHGIQYC